MAVHMHYYMHIDFNTREIGGMSEPEMLKTFNCGIGMVLVVDPSRAEEIAQLLGDAGESVCTLGTVSPGAGVRYTGGLL
jgi:phosphoribosylformylglycinamidine cyclo-ligase